MVCYNINGLYGIADQEVCPALSMEKKISQLLTGGASVVQIRMKNSAGKKIWQVACRAMEMAQGKALIIINDRPDVALAAGTDGVHIGEDDLPLAAVKKLVGAKMLIGATVRTSEEAEMAVSQGASYLGFGPVYSTTTKFISTPVRGIAALAQVVSAVSVPVVAIGGITWEKVGEVASSGASAVAVISGIFQAPDPSKQAQRIKQAFFASTRII